MYHRAWTVLLVCGNGAAHSGASPGGFAPLLGALGPPCGEGVPSHRIPGDVAETQVGDIPRWLRAEEPPHDASIR